MKNTFKKYIPLLLITLFSSCELMTSYDIDTAPSELLDYNMLDFMKTGKDTIITMFYEAVVHAEMVEDLSNSTVETIIIPSNTAFIALLKEAGYSSITEMNKSALRGLLEYLFVPGRFVSYESTDNEIHQVITRSGDRIYIGRKSSATDDYVMYVNELPETETELASTSMKVSRQDMVFKNKVAQVVDGFPRFLMKIPATDNAPEMGIRLNIEGDTHTWAGAASTNVYWDKAVQGGNRTVSNLSRTAMMLFENKSVSTLSEISSATLNLYVIANPTSDPQVSSLNFYDISNEIDWSLLNIKTITKSFKPSLTDSTTLIKEATGFDTAEKWYQVDITDFIKKYYENPDRKQFFMAIQPSIVCVSGNFSFGWKHETNDTKSVNPAYIDILGPINTELHLVNNNPINCPKKLSVTFTNDMLSMIGPDFSVKDLVYTNNNIIYRIKELPTDGVITKGGLPLGVNGQFSQADIEFKNVKYFNNGNSASDSFKLEGRDYAGGTLNDLITVNINIQ